MKILSIDFGVKKIGISIWDTDIKIAFLRDYLSNNKNVFKEIEKLCDFENIDQIIIWEPLMLDWEISESLIKTKQFVENLKWQINLPIKFVDERFTTNIAQNRLNQGLCKKKNKKEKIDSASAQVLLERYFKFDI